MEKFNHETATVADLISVLEFTEGPTPVLICRVETGCSDENDLRNFAQFQKLGIICKVELMQRLSLYLDLK